MTTSNKYCKTVLLGAVCLIVVTSLAGSRTSVIHPIGPQMCERLCQNTIGCSFYIFGIHDLSCHVTDIKPSTRKGFISFPALENRNKLYLKTTPKCGKFAKIFQNRRQASKCSQFLTKEVQHVKMKKLLILSNKSTHSLQARIFFIHNSSVVTYPFIKGKFTAVVYISSYNRLIVGTWESNQLIFISVTDGKQTVIKESINVMSISVDETKKQFFLIRRLKKYIIHVMTTEGKDFKTIVSCKSEARDITVDCKRSRIYFLMYHRINVYTYHGNKKSSMYPTKVRQVLFLDSENDILYYYSLTSRIYSMPLSVKYATLLLQSKDVIGLLGFESSLFISYYRSNSEKMRVRNIKNGTRSWINTGLNGTTQVLMCLID